MQGENNRRGSLNPMQERKWKEEGVVLSWTINGDGHASLRRILQGKNSVMKI